MPQVVDCLQCGIMPYKPAELGSGLAARTTMRQALFLGISGSG